MPDSPSSERASPLPQRRVPQHREDRRRVGRGDRRADDQRLERAEVEEPGGGDAGDHRGHDRADDRQRDRGPDHRPDLLPAGGQAALEEDQDQADRPQRPGQLDVVELDADRRPRRRASRGRGRGPDPARAAGRRPSRRRFRSPAAAPPIRISSASDISCARPRSPFDDHRYLRLRLNGASAALRVFERAPAKPLPALR